MREEHESEHSTKTAVIEKTSTRSNLKRQYARKTTHTAINAADQGRKYANEITGEKCGLNLNFSIWFDHLPDYDLLFLHYECKTKH